MNLIILPLTFLLLFSSCKSRDFNSSEVQRLKEKNVKVQCIVDKDDYHPWDGNGSRRLDELGVRLYRSNNLFLYSYTCTEAGGVKRKEITILFGSGWGGKDITERLNSGKSPILFGTTQFRLAKDGPIVGVPMLRYGFDTVGADNVVFCEKWTNTDPQQKERGMPSLEETCHLVADYKSETIKITVIPSKSK